MSQASSVRCLTRVMIDDDCGIEIAQRQVIVHRIQCMLHGVPPAQREYIADALLNLALARMRREAGDAQGAGIVLRLEER